MAKLPCQEPVKHLVIDKLSQLIVQMRLRILQKPAQIMSNHELDLLEIGTTT
jgi:hypothetical protein